MHLPEFAANNVYREFFRGLSCMPNLKTLQILSVSDNCHNALSRAVHCKALDKVSYRYRYESVKSVFLPAHTGELLLPCFPNIVRLFLRCDNDPAEECQEVFTVIKEHCPLIEEIDYPFPWQGIELSMLKGKQPVISSLGVLTLYFLDFILALPNIALLPFAFDVALEPVSSFFYAPQRTCADLRPVLRRRLPERGHDSAPTHRPLLCWL